MFPEVQGPLCREHCTGSQDYLIIHILQLCNIRPCNLEHSSHHSAISATQNCLEHKTHLTVRSNSFIHMHSNFTSHTRLTPSNPVDLTTSLSACCRLQTLYTMQLLSETSYDALTGDIRVVHTHQTRVHACT
jgi:hypothetical protein